MEAPAEVCVDPSLNVIPLAPTVRLDSVPTDVISDKLPEVITVPDTFGKLIVLSAVGSMTPNVVSKSSGVEPSKVNELVISIVVEFTVVVVPLTVRSPVTVKLFPMVTLLGNPIVRVSPEIAVSISF